MACLVLSRYKPNQLPVKYVIIDSKHMERLSVKWSLLKADFKSLDLGVWLNKHDLNQYTK